MLHSRGIVHGNITPQNLLLDKKGSSTVITLINYEMARYTLNMDKHRSRTFLWEELDRVCQMVESLTRFQGLEEYRSLVRRLQAGMQSRQPLPAKDMAQEIEAILAQYPNRPSLFLKKCRWKIRLAFNALRRRSEPSTSYG